jgi:hypothetical protein
MNTARFYFRLALSAAIFLAALVFARHAWADTTRRTIGNMDFYQSSDGRTATGTQIGNTYFVQDYGNGLAGEVATK